MTDTMTTPLDAADLQKCALCGKGMMHAGKLFFYRVTIENCIIDHKNVQRMHGMEMMFGGSVALARIFSPDNTVAHIVPAKPKFLCADCMLNAPAASLIGGDDD